MRTSVSPETELVSQWRQLLTRHARTWSELDRTLNARHRLTASAFEVLDRLVETAGCKLRAQDLAETTHLSQSALSRLVAQMEKENLVQRNICDQDRRGIFVTITDIGRERHAAACPTHRAVLAAFAENHA